MQPIEIITVSEKEVSCDGGKGALGHPLVYLEMGAKDHVVCPYCSKRFEYVASAHGHKKASH